MFARRLYKLVRPSADEPEPLYEALREEDEERLAKRLYELDRSSTQFLEPLDKLLQNEGWIKDLQRLSQHKLMEFIDYLDNVRFISMPYKPCSSSLQILDGLDRTGSQFREGLYVLRELCGSRAIVPATYLVSGKLSFSTTIITMSGESGEIHKGSIGGVDFCIKKLGTTARNWPAKIRQVSRSQSLARSSCPHEF